MELSLRLPDQTVVTVECHQDAAGLRTLLKVVPALGRSIEWEHLRGGRFPDLAALERAVIAAWRGPVETLDLINISPAAYQAWMAKARETVSAWLRVGAVRTPEEIPDEKGRVLEDGSLEIYAELPSGLRASLVVPPEQWAWRIRPS